jgi:hypothetical protein
VRNGRVLVRGIMNGSPNLVWNWHESIGFDSRKYIHANNISNGWRIIFLSPLDRFLVDAFQLQWHPNIKSKITPSNVIVIITELPKKRRGLSNIQADMFRTGSRSHSPNDFLRPMACYEPLVLKEEGEQEHERVSLQASRAIRYKQLTSRATRKVRSW